MNGQTFEVHYSRDIPKGTMVKIFHDEEDYRHWLSDPAHWDSHDLGTLADRARSVNPLL